ncbi:metallophosphoesterase [Archangium violaceum]|uniref:metallophosphoesterase n=1 Tax=Archangium violaceum TaxID=83451 RepID=UPI0036DAC5A3
MARLGWLHLSDLLIGPRGSRLLQPEYREALEQDLRKLHARSGPWDLVLISGNLTLTGSVREFELLDSTLDSLWKYLNSLGSDPSLLVVPGSSDFRKLKVSSQERTRNAEPQAASVRKAFQRSGTGSLEQIVWDALTPFSDWFNAWRHAHSSPRLQTFRKGLLPGDFAATLSTKGLKVGVVGLNSLFRNVPSGRQGSAHEIDVAQVEAALVEGTRTWAREHDLVLLLTHHSPLELRGKSLEQLLARVVPPNGFGLHLSAWGTGTAAGPFQTSERVLNVRAHSLFGLDGDDEWGYSAGDIDLEDSRREGRVRFFPRATSSTAIGSIILMPDESWSLDEDDAFAIPLGALFDEAGGDDSSLPLQDFSPAPGSSKDIRVTASAPESKQAAPPGVKFREMLSTGHEAVRRLAWSPTGDAIAIGLSDGRLLYWKMGEDEPRWVVQAHAAEVLDLCISPDGRQLVSCSGDDTRICFTTDGMQLHWVGLSERQGGCLAWSPDNFFAVGAMDGLIQILDASKPFESTRIDTGPIGLHRIAWSPDSRTLVCSQSGDGDLLILWPSEDAGRGVMKVQTGHQGAIHDLAWMPGSQCIATASRDWTVRIWDMNRGPSLHVLQQHTDIVLGVAFSFDGRLLASKSLDGTILLFRTDTWEKVARIEEQTSHLTYGGLAFSPKGHVLASLGTGGRAVRLWDIDIENLLSSRPPSTTVHTVSAKVVLVGEGNAGKSCLALRLAEDRYEELGSTHGMRFWSVPEERILPGEGARAGIQRELILWDMGGQGEYRLVHQLFLRDSTLALMVMEPRRGRAALDELEGWNQHMLAQTGERPIRKLLVGTKVDDEHAPVDQFALQRFVEQHQALDYVLTSARTGKGIPALKAALSRAIDWDAIEKVSSPELFQRLREHIQKLREARRVVLTFTDLESELRGSSGAPFDAESLRAVVAQLARQGLVADTRMADGTRALILEVEQVERYAGSLILAARDNLHGVPAIDVAKMQSPSATLLRIRPEERLRRDQELIVLDCVVQLLLEHGLCLRHEGLLIFPSLFRPEQSETGTDFPHAVSLLYDFSGAIDNIYASLITSLAVSRRFGRVRLWENRAEFGRAGEDTSGVRRVQQAGQGARGHARLDVYFDVNTPQSTRELFVSFVEEHLREQGVHLLEKLDITCACGRVFPEDIVQARIDAGLPDIGCPACDRRTALTLGAQQSQERNPEIAGQLRALRTHIRKHRSESIVETKVRMTEAQRVMQKQDTPIRILHLSDLHVGAGDDPISLFQPLVADLSDTQDGLGVERLDYLVISGDITNRATPEEFEKARELVSRLIEQFGLTAERCIIVPGNHDLHWDTDVYTFKKKRQVSQQELKPGRYVEQQDGYLIRDEARYSDRFRNFSQHFYHPLLQKEYPLLPEQQCIPFLFSETRLQFLAMNSAWEIDEYFRDRSGIEPGALSRGLDAAKQQVENAIKAGALTPGSKLLRIGVWHHPITGNEKIHADAFMDRLAQAEVRVCLHGHVHEDRVALLKHLEPTRQIHIIGAGSFGAPTAHRPESVPRLFNLMEVERDLRRIRVRTRCMRKQGGAWEGWAVWPGTTRDEKRTYYEVGLP